MTSAKREQWKGKGWTVYTCKGPILSSAEIEAAESRIGIPMPEMIFGNNEVGLEHESGWSIRFNALDALDLVNKTGDNNVKVAHSEEWLSTRQSEGEVRGIVKPFDWTYTTEYYGTTAATGTKSTAGTAAGNGDEGARDTGGANPASTVLVPSSAEIPISLLSRPDPILFFGDVSLYEDELGDNGLVSFNVKIRVMEERLLLLCRLYLRVDGVLFRIRDTRVFVEFAEGRIIRQYQQAEEEYSRMKSKIRGKPEDFSQYLGDPNWTSRNIAVEKVTTEQGFIPRGPGAP